MPDSSGFSFQMQQTSYKSQDNIGHSPAAQELV